LFAQRNWHPRPEKPGNRVEDKTGMTCDRVYRGSYESKAMDACEGRKFIRRFPRLMLRKELNTSYPTGGALRWQ